MEAAPVWMIGVGWGYFFLDAGWILRVMNFSEKSEVFFVRHVSPGHRSWLRIILRAGWEPLNGGSPPLNGVSGWLGGCDFADFCFFPAFFPKLRVFLSLKRP